LDDGVEVEILDLYDFGGGSYYFGEWKKDHGGGKLTRHGRGIYHFGNAGKDGGCSYISQCKDDQFYGICKMLWDNGKVQKAEFKNGEVKWL
jgi:hypothetical protein